VPLFYQQDINEFTRLGVWHITEGVDFFLKKAVFRYPIEHPNKQRQHLAAGYLLSELFPDFPYPSIQSPSFQKPFLPDNPYFFSLSHSNEYAAAIVSRSVPTGIDIEMIAPRVQRIRHKFWINEKKIKRIYTSLDESIWNVNPKAISEVETLLDKSNKIVLLFRSKYNQISGFENVFKNLFKEDL
jgi:hypothetical protein